MPEQKTAQQPAQEEKQEQLAVLGAKLKSLREAQGLTIADISSETKIQKQYIEAMESGRLEILPKGPYTRSFLKQYCTRLCATDLWDGYDALTQDKKLIVRGNTDVPHDTEHNYTNKPKTFKKRSFLWIYAIVIISICAAAWITWQYRSDFASVSTSPTDGGTTSVEAPAAPIQEQEQHPAAAPVSADAQIAPAETSVDLGWMDGKPPSAAAPAAVRSADAPAAQAANNVLRITANSVVWAKVSQNKTTMFEGLMQPGESKEYKVTDTPLRVRFGNPSKTAIFWNGQETNPVDGGGKPITRYYHQDGTVTDKY